MGKPRQQTISRFFSANLKPNEGETPASSQPAFPNTKVTTIASFSPSKRKLMSSQISQHMRSPDSKRSRILHSPHTGDSIPSTSALLHQRFVEKLLEPSPSPSPFANDCGTLSNHESRDGAKYTPLEQQVVELKMKYPDILLMIEVGYKYRFFGEDAATASRVLGIYSHVDHNFLTASVPTFRLNVHVRRLVNEGYKVGVVKQTETAAIKAHGTNKSAPFTRRLSGLYTKATLEAAEDLGDTADECGGESSYLCCLVEKVVNTGLEMDSLEAKIGVVAIEISTGDVIYRELEDGLLRNGLEAFLLSIAPSELLLGNPLSKATEKLLLSYAGSASNVRVERVLNCFNNGGAISEMASLIQSFYEDDMTVEEAVKQSSDQKHSTLPLDIVNMPELVVQALALTTRHLQQFGFEKIIFLGSSFRSFSNETEMNLSANTLQQLEILCNNSDGSKTGSLLHVINQTLTRYGSRLLRHWVTHPLRDINMISGRLDAVSEIAEWMGPSEPFHQGSEIAELSPSGVLSQTDFYFLFSNLLVTLGRSPDLQRGITRIFHRTASPKEFIQVIQALLHASNQLHKLHTSRTLKSPLLKRLISDASSSSLVNLAQMLLSMLNSNSAEKGDFANLFTVARDQFSEVGEARKKVQIANEDLDSLIHIYRKKPRMRNVDFITVSGTTHLIELPYDFEVPADWVKVNSTKKMIRYHPREVLTALERLSLAKEELLIVSRAAWDKFLKTFSKHYSEFQRAVHALSSLDCLHSLAKLSRNKNYVRPEFVDNSEPVQIRITSGRHPILETILPDVFVPNDTELHAEKERCQIITGPNMGGKSCYIRQVALLSLMAQVGSYVPASSATLHVVDNIYTRIGGSDAIQQGKSTFWEEMGEASNILQKCTNKSLVIMDELGRGTSTHDGNAIAYATMRHLLQHNKCLLLFVTHYAKLADIKKEFPAAVGVYHVSYLTTHSDSDTEDVTYLYKLVHGACDKSFAFKVAQIAQVPSGCIKRASDMAAKLERLVQTRMSKNIFSGVLSFVKRALECENHEDANQLLENAELYSGVVRSITSIAESFEGLGDSIVRSDSSSRRSICKLEVTFASKPPRFLGGGFLRFAFSSTFLALNSAIFSGQALKEKIMVSDFGRSREFIVCRQFTAQ